MTRSTLDRSRPPAADPPRPFRFPPFEVVPLDTGTRLFVARQDHTPLVDLQVFFAAGADRDPAGEAGLGSLTAALLDEGTGRRSARDLAAAVENLGGYLASGAGWNTGFAAIGMLGKDLEAGLDVLCEVCTDPSFPDEEVERLRRRRLAELKQRRDDPTSLAGDLLSRVLYGDGPYGCSTAGEEESVAAIDRDDCRSFFERHYSAASSFVIATGDLDSERLASVLADGLATLQKGPVAPRPTIEPRQLPGIEIHVLDRPHAAQTELRIGHAGAAGDHPDRPALRLLNSILGGKFTSRINLNLREAHGYTYGASSRFLERLGPGPFVVSTAVATEVAGAATQEVLGELRRICDEPVAIEELEDARSYLLGVFPYTLQTIQGVSARLQEIATYDLPLDTFDRYPEVLRATTREAILDVARRHLDPDRLAVIAVGPASQLQSQLALLGPVEVHESLRDDPTK